MPPSTSEEPSFGLLLRELRHEAGLTQAGLAERAGISPRAVQHLEGGFGKPQVETAGRLAEALALSDDRRSRFIALAAPAPRGRATRRNGTASVERSESGQDKPVQSAPRPLALDSPALGRLPTHLASFVGREEELGRVEAVLLRPGVRLVTLTGPPGAGKTRLATELATRVAEAFGGAVAFIPLATLRDPDLIMATVAQVFDLPVAGTTSPVSAVAGFIGDHPMLLVLDNFEQVLPGALQVVELLGACPNLRVVATSRAVLRVRGEHEIVVAPLPLPDPRREPSIESLAACASVSLFVDRAQAARTDFELTPENAGIVAEICARLDGLPLAIELAAARIRLFAPQAMLTRLERRLPMLTGGAVDLPRRHQKLHDTIAWSYDLLDADEQTIFRRLATFVGGCTLDAAEAVCSTSDNPSLSVTDVLFSLVDRSLVRQQDDPDGEPRFSMLETIREYATELLERSGESAALRDRHLDWMLQLAEAATAAGRSPAQGAWFDRLERDNDNLQAALRWSATPASGNADRVVRGIRLAAALEHFWALRARGRESLSVLLDLLGLTESGTALHARALTVAAFVRGDILGDYPAATPMVEEALRIWRELDDSYGIAVALERQGRLALPTGRLHDATAALSEARDGFLSLGRASSLNVPIALEVAWAHHAEGHTDRAEPFYQEALSESRALGDSHSVALAIQGIARLRSAADDTEGAVTLLHESLSLFGPLNDIRCAPFCLLDLAVVLCERGDASTVVRLLAAAETLRASRGRPPRRQEAEVRDRTLARVRERLDATAFGKAWEDGRAMGLVEAISFALRDGRPT